ncbi:MAG: efflux RND transporter permease subunit [Halanaerobium sp.]|nr:efflux RND transporter permease subunit [Halanaerobium sp.]
MLAGFSVKKPFIIIVAVTVIIILGAISLMNMSADLIPDINLPYAVISTIYPGATPETVEMTVTRPFEQAMSSISNIKIVRSISRENSSLLILEFTANADMDTALIEMREGLDMVRTYLPEEVSNPVILKLNPDMMPVMVISAAVKDEQISESARFLQERIIPELESVEGVAAVTATGLVEREVRVILDQDKVKVVNKRLESLLSTINNTMPDKGSGKDEEEQPGSNLFQGFPGSFNPAQLASPSAQEIPDLSEYRISRDLVAGIIRAQNISMPAGYITEGEGEFTVRVGDRLEGITELKNLPILALPVPFFQPIVLADIADIVVSDNSAELYSRVNGHDAIILSLSKQTEYGTADVSRRIRARMQEIGEKYQDVEITTLMDQGEYIDLVVSSLFNNLLLGGALAIFILLLFLRDFKPTIIVGLAIPISLVTAFVLMYFGNVTLIIISMGGLALGVGMLVDNSIVVIENIYRLRTEGKSEKEAATAGANQVAGAITASTLTTVAVFAPILFTEGFTRQIFSDMGLTIAYSLLASLLIALTFVPLLASRIMVKGSQTGNGLLAKITEKYSCLLEYLLEHKWLVIIPVVILFVVSLLGAINNGAELFPASDTTQLMVEVSMPPGTDFSETRAVADETVARISEIDGVKTVGASISGGLFGGIGQFFGGGGKRSVSIYVILADERVGTSSKIAGEIKDKTEGLPAEIIVNDTGMDMAAISGGEVNVKIMGRDLDILQKLARDIASLVSDISGTTDVSAGLEETSPEIRVTVNKDKSIAYGLTVAQVLLAISQYINEEGTVTNLQADEHEYDILVMEDEEAKQIKKEEISNLSIATPLGTTVKVKDIAVLDEGLGFSAIRRESQQRYVTVTAGVAPGFNIGQISEKVQEKIDDYQLPVGYSTSLGGEQQLIRDSFQDLYLMLALGVILIYLIMVAQFESLLAPFIVMFTIPLAFTGGFLSLLLTGNPVSIVAFIGLIVLSGVVVNNGIVFVDYIRLLTRDGMAKTEAIIKAGKDRLRPIVMTALTTIFALSTMALGIGRGTEMVRPLALTAIGGLVYATFLTLFLIPVLYDSLQRE